MILANKLLPKKGKKHRENRGEKKTNKRVPQRNIK
jgi:hypothetical protein